jgi:hypothetical protein
LNLSEKRRLEKEVEIDFAKLARVGNKINELLIRKTKNTAEAYAVLRFLSVFYEQNKGLSFQPEFEEELKKMFKRSLERGASS